ncbi:guanine nucleotide-binding protein G(q) subunit alpha [Aphelenchoides avenae]|nr:guanine nucleotide-binding protein G(q) subunit alpha [Aphelenchus avenae]
MNNLLDALSCEGCTHALDRLVIEPCLTDEARERRRISREIDRQLTKDRRKSRKEYKLLLLGIAEAGKSTFIKQMQIIHGTGFSDKDREHYKPLVFQNLVTAIQTIIQAMEMLGITYSNFKTEEKAEAIRVLNVNDITSLHEPLVSYIEDVWKDPDTQKAYKRKREYHLTDSAKYYLDSLRRLAAPDYIPTEQDILRVRVPTTGIVEYPFKVTDVIFRIVDVGGQRTERRKWIHCFQDVTSIMFLAALSEYDQTLAECDNENRMEESVALFKVILASSYLNHSSVMLFLNKKDIFAEKIQTSHLADYFPEYEGPEKNAELAGDFIRDMYVGLVPEGTNIYPHFTCATDTQNINVVFTSVRNTILMHNIKSYGLF